MPRSGGVFFGGPISDFGWPVAAGTGTIVASHGLFEPDDFADLVRALGALECAPVVIRFVAREVEASQDHPRAASWAVRPLD